MALEARGRCRMEMDQNGWSGEGLEGVGDVTLFPQSMWCMNSSPEQHPLAMFGTKEQGSQSQVKEINKGKAVLTKKEVPNRTKWVIDGRPGIQTRRSPFPSSQGQPRV